MPQIVYGVRVSNRYEGVGVVEATFSSEARACAYALTRSAERYGNAGDVSLWVVDSPDGHDWVVSFEDGVEKHRNNRRAARGA